MWLQLKYVEKYGLFLAYTDKLRLSDAELAEVQQVDEAKALFEAGCALSRRACVWGLTVLGA